MADDNTFGWVINEQSVIAPQLEYMRKNRWVLEILMPTSFASSPDETSPESVGLRINCSTAARPSISFEDTEVHRINGRVYLAGKPTYDPMTVTFYDSMPIGNVGIETPSMVLERWRRQIYAPEKGDAFGAVVAYKAVARLVMLSPNQQIPDDSQIDSLEYQESNFQDWLIYGMYPQAINYSDLDYSNSEVQLVEVTFRYDRAFVTNLEGSQAGADSIDPGGTPSVTG